MVKEVDLTHYVMTYGYGYHMISYIEMLYSILRMCYIICELTVYGTDQNPSLDEGGVDVQHDGDRHLARTHSRLGNLKRHRSVCMTTKDAVPVGGLVLLELVELVVLEQFVRQQLPQHHLHLAFKESDILLTIAVLTQSRISICPSSTARISLSCML